MAYNPPVTDNGASGWRVLLVPAIRAWWALRWLGGHRAIRSAVLAVVGLCGLGVVVWGVPPALYPTVAGQPAPSQPRATLQAGMLAGMLTVAAATIAYAGVRATLGAARRANELTQRRDNLTHDREIAEHRSARYTAAITQLGSPSIEIRLGGIYALERLAKDSPDDHPTIVEVLSAFVRTRSTDPELRPPPPADGQDPAPDRRAVDIRAAVQVLGRLPHRDDLPALPRADLDGADLTGPASLADIDLTDADLRGAWLEGADLTRARLDGAILTDARLNRANLTHAHLDGADLTDAHLQGADLTWAQLAERRTGADQTVITNLTRARLDGAILTDARLIMTNLTAAHLTKAVLINVQLHGADLTRAWLNGVDLTRAHGLTQEQLNAAIGDAETRLTWPRTRPALWPPPAGAWL